MPPRGDDVNANADADVNVEYLRAEVKAALVECKGKLVDRMKKYKIKQQKQLKKLTKKWDKATRKIFDTCLAETQLTFLTKINLNNGEEEGEEVEAVEGGEELEEKNESVPESSKVRGRRIGGKGNAKVAAAVKGSKASRQQHTRVAKTKAKAEAEAKSSVTATKKRKR